MDLLLELILIAVTLALAFIAGQAYASKQQATQQHLLPKEQQLPIPIPVFSPSEEEDEDEDDEDDDEDDEDNSGDEAPDPADPNSGAPEIITSASFSSASFSFPTNSSVPSIKKRRVVIVAKTLPVRTTRDADGKWTIEWEDTRNFLSALQVLRTNDQIDVKWVGTPNSNVEIKPSEQDDYEEMLFDERTNCIPVFLPKLLSERFFHGFCKTILWPMLHYVMPQSNQHFGEMWDDLWQAFTAANTLYASVVTHAVETPTDMIWVQNYHLLLLPSLLRTKLPRAKIGLFIHTPFPSSDVFRVLPTRQNILSSIMATDLIGFHTFDYARHFLSCIKRVMDLDFETLPGGALGVKYNGRFVSISISHVGIDSLKFRSLTSEDPVKERMAQIKKQFGDRQIVLGIDDYDIVKGALLKLQAYHHFLLTHPEWHSKMVFVQFLLPSSNKDDTDYRNVIQDELSKIRRQYGNDVIYVKELKGEQDNSMAEMVAWYSVSSVCCISTFWDGLNLFPYEYSVCQSNESPGVLVISEFMGCSRSLNGVIRVNPWSLIQVADAIHTALSMPMEERRANHARRYNYVMNHSIERWGLGFLEQLDKATKFQSSMNYVQVGWGSNVKLMGLRNDFAHLEDEAVTSGYRKAAKRVLLLDYDGTLTPVEKVGIKSRLIGPSYAIKRILKQLTADEDNCVFIMSGRTRSVLAEWFEDLPELGLAAEKGLFLKWPMRLMTSCRADGATWKEEDSIREREENKRKLQSQRSRSNSIDPRPSGQSSPSSSSEDVADALVVQNDWECLIPLEDVDWKETALSLIQSYQEQTDGSWIEPKEFAIVWHYENADPEYGRMQAAELQKYLVKLLANPDVDVVKYDYARLLEVKPHGISKGLAANAILESYFLKSKVQQLQLQRELTARENSNATILRSPRGSSAFIASGSSPLLAAVSNTAPPALIPASPVSSHSPSPTLGRAASRPNSPSASPPLSGFDSNQRSPFLLCVGDDRSDEDMFVAVNEKEYLKGLVRGGSGEFIRLRRSWSTRQREFEEKQRTEAAAASSSTTASATTTPTAAAGQDVSLTLMGAKKDEEEEKWDTDVIKPKQPPDPFTFTVCVGMKPSNAHYYLHDDEEVVKMLLSLATCSQRMAETRRLDNEKITEMVRNDSSMMLARTASTPSIVQLPENAHHGGSQSNLQALLQQNSLSVGSNTRGQFVLSAMSPVNLVSKRSSASSTPHHHSGSLASVHTRGPPPVRGGGGGSRVFPGAGAGRDLSEKSDEEEEEVDDDAPDNEYASGSDDEGTHIEY